MEDLIIFCLRLIILFLRNVLGCINKPYITYRKLADNSADVKQVVFIVLLVLGYFSLASLIKTGIRNPFLLTAKFNSLLITFIIGFILSLSVFYIMGKINNKSVILKSIIILWAYSLLPTIIWFFITSVFYIILPPPRNLTVLGKIYSIVYISFSIGILYWKVILYYLTLRFGLRFDFKKIMITTSVYLPVMSIFSIEAYRLGVFRIPFI
jgi:hypothetical protein